MFTLAEFKDALPYAISILRPGVVVPDNGTLLLEQLAGDINEDCFSTENGIWFCCGNEDAYFPYDGPHTAVEAAAALSKMYIAWGIQYDPQTGFSM